MLVSGVSVVSGVVLREIRFSETGIGLVSSLSEVFLGLVREESCVACGEGLGVFSVFIGVAVGSGLVD